VRLGPTLPRVAEADQQLPAWTRLNLVAAQQSS